MAHEFLSDEWFTAVAALGPPPAGAAPAAGSINVVVTMVDGDDVEVHLTDGRLARGLAAEAAMTVRTTYDVAKAVFLTGDQHAAMQAFISGQVKVEGDLTTLMALSRTIPTPDERTYAKQLLALTR